MVGMDKVCVFIQMVTFMKASGIMAEHRIGW